MAEYTEYIARYYASHADIPEGHYDGEIVKELTRCKDCKSRSEVSYKDILGFNLYRCLVHECYVMDRDFCSFAWRK